MMFPLHADAHETLPDLPVMPKLISYHAQACREIG